MRSCAAAALVACAATAGAAAACGERSGRASQAAAAASAVPGDPALGAYRGALARLAPAETVALEALAATTGERYTDDEALLQALRGTSLPRYREFVAGLERVAAPTPELRDFHARLVEAAREQLGVLERLEAAVARGDGTAVLFVNQEQRRVRARLDALAAEFERLAAPALEARADPL